MNFLDRRDAVLAGRLVLPALVILALGISGCGGAHLSNMWRDPTFNSPMGNVFVVALKEDPGNRRLWEDELVKEIGEAGASAVPSYRLFPNAVPDTNEVVAAVRRENFDGVLIVYSHEPVASETYVPGYVTTEPIARVDPWSRRWVTYYVAVEHPGYYETNTVLRDQVDLWTTGPQARLVWSGTGEVINPASAHDVRDAVADRIVPELAKNGLISTAGK
jgi:hypothetical protein